VALVRLKRCLVRAEALSREAEAGSRLSVIKPGYLVSNSRLLIKTPTSDVKTHTTDSATLNP